MQISFLTHGNPYDRDTALFGVISICSTADYARCAGGDVGKQHLVMPILCDYKFLGVRFFGIKNALNGSLWRCKIFTLGKRTYGHILPPNAITLGRKNAM
jgi:hypothetical protein